MYIEQLLRPLTLPPFVCKQSEQGPSRVPTQGTLPVSISFMTPQCAFELLLYLNTVSAVGVSSFQWP